MIEPIQLVIVDDHPLYREGVASTLNAESDMRVIGEGGTAVLLDINMPGGGIQAAKTVSEACPVTKIIMLTFSEEENDVLSALKAGARGYILKGVSGRELKSVIRSVYHGEVYITPTLAAGVLSEMARGGSRRSQPSSLLDELTEREHQILELVASGRSNKEIGGKLELTEKTVKHYMTNILQKLQVRNRVEAALLAQKSALG
jgi:two-component system, NarL family, nitrate/nitrite response regulator NarL